MSGEAEKSHRTGLQLVTENQEWIRRVLRIAPFLAALSVGGAVALSLIEATGHQIDFDIYRMGAAHVLGMHLYDARLPRSLISGSRGMHFTYPPFAALLFLPFVKLPVDVAQAAWSVLNILIFVVFLIVTRQFRAAMTALATFLLCTLGALAIAPRSSWVYWSTEVFNARRSGNLLYISDQNLQSEVQRIVGAHLTLAILTPLGGVFALAGLEVAAWAYYASSPILGILICAATGLVVSPVSWVHHYVWIVPVLVWLTFAQDRPRGGRWWALGAAALFWAAPMWRVTDLQQGFGGQLTLVEGNAFCLAAITFIALTAARLWWRRRLGVAAEAQASAALA